MCKHLHPHMVTKTKGSVMDCVRWLLAFGQRRPQQNRDASTCPVILQVPNEILLEIIDHLRLHDEFLLSQTCRTFRKLTQRNWKLASQQLSFLKGIEFRTGLAYVLPNRYVCGPCGKLHAMHKWDRPETYRPVPLCQQSRYLTFDRIYPLRHTHVQLALKLTRMGSINQKYLNRILSPFTSETLSFPYPQLRLHYCAIPRVVGERFLLQVKREWRGLDNTMRAVSPDELRLERVCPHMAIMPSTVMNGRRPNDRATKVFALDGLSKDVHLACSTYGRAFSGYCERCPTDYTVFANAGIITAYSWHDLGSYGTPFSQRWTVHIETDQNIYCNGPVVHHHAGTVREMYLGASTDMFSGT